MAFKLFDQDLYNREQPIHIELDLNNIDEIFENYHHFFQGQRKRVDSLIKQEKGEMYTYLDVIYTIMEYRNYFAPSYIRITDKELEAYQNKHTSTILDINFESIIQYYLGQNLEQEEFLTTLPEGCNLLIPKKYRFKESYNLENLEYISNHTIASVNPDYLTDIDLDAYLNHKGFFYALSNQNQFSIPGINYYNLFKINNDASFTLLNQSIKERIGADIIYEGRLTQKDLHGYFLFEGNPLFSSKQRFYYYLFASQLLNQALFNQYAQAMVKNTIINQEAEDFTFQSRIEEFEELEDDQFLYQFDDYYNLIADSQESDDQKYRYLEKGIKRIVESYPHIDVGYYMEYLELLEKRTENIETIRNSNSSKHTILNQYESFVEKMAYFIVHFGNNYYLDNILNIYEWSKRKYIHEQFSPLFALQISKYISKSIANDTVQYQFERFNSLTKYLKKKRKNRTYKNIINNAKLEEMKINQGFVQYKNLIGSLLTNLEENELNRDMKALIRCVMEANTLELAQKHLTAASKLMLIKRQTIRLYYIVLSYTNKKVMKNTEYKKVLVNDSISSKELVEKLFDLLDPSRKTKQYNLLYKLIQQCKSEVSEQSYNDNFGMITTNAIDMAFNKNYKDIALENYLEYLERNIEEIASQKIKEQELTENQGEEG